MNEKNEAIKTTTTGIREDILEPFKKYCKINNLNKTGVLSDLLESYLITEKAIEKKQIKYKIIKCKLNTKVS